VAAVPMTVTNTHNVNRNENSNRNMSAYFCYIQPRQVLTSLIYIIHNTIHILDSKKNQLFMY